MYIPPSHPIINKCGKGSEDGNDRFYCTQKSVHPEGGRKKYEIKYIVGGVSPFNTKVEATCEALPRHMYVHACATLFLLLWLVLLDRDVKSGDRLDEVVVIGAAMWALDLLRELGEA